MKFIFLDTAPVIYLTEAPPDVRSALRHKMENWIRQGMLFCTSVLTLTELLIPAKKSENARHVFQLKSSLYELCDIPFCKIDELQAERAAEIRAEYNFSTPDSLQLAAAQSMQCEIFFTNDKKLLRFKELEIVLALP